MMQAFYFNVWLVLLFALSQLLIIFSPKLDGYSCLGKTSYFSHNGSPLFTLPHHQWKKSPPTVQQGTELAAAGCTNMHPINCLAAGSIWICRFFITSQCVSASFPLTLGISFCADTYPKSNLYETILLRQAFCELLNDGCLREMVIMIDFEP